MPSSVWCAGQPGLEVAHGREFFKVANNGQPFLKNWDAFTYPPEDSLTFYPMPPQKGAITVNIGTFATSALAVFAVLGPSLSVLVLC